MATVDHTQNGSDAGRKSDGGLARLWTRFRARFAGRPTDTPLRESLDEAIDEAIEERTSADDQLRDEERVMIQNIVKFGGIRVEDVMVPRADIVGVEIDTTIQELAKIFEQAAHSRLPVYRESLDDPVGMVHIKDLIGCMIREESAASGAPTTISSIKREILFVPPSMPIVDLLLRMQATRIHMALVIDEYGGTDGLVTIEDLVEEIVGEIEDEHDEEEATLINRTSPSRIDADARAKITDLEELLKCSLSLPEREEDIDTLGGLVFSLVGRVPQRGELIAHPAGLDFEVVDADPRRIKRLRIDVKDDLQKDLGDQRLTQESRGVRTNGARRNGSQDIG